MSIKIYLRVTGVDIGVSNSSTISLHKETVFLLPAKHLGYSDRFNLEWNLKIDLN